MKLKVRDLRLGDTVRLGGSSPFMDAIVAEVNHDYVKVQRPYARCDDFSYSDPPRVIVLTGMETFSLMKSSEFPYEVLERKVIR